MPQRSFLEFIGGTLRVQHNYVVREPLPQRWIDLINYLNEREANEGETQRKLSRRRKAGAARKRS